MRKVKAQLASGTWKRNSFNGVLQRATKTLEEGKYGKLIGGGWGLHKCSQSNTRRPDTVAETALMSKPNNRSCHFIHDTPRVHK